MIIHLFLNLPCFALTALEMAAATKVKYPEKLVLCVGELLGISESEHLKN
jgi:hypothetical protein